MIWPSAIARQDKPIINKVPINTLIASIPKIVEQHVLFLYTQVIQKPLHGSNHHRRATHVILTIFRGWVVFARERVLARPIASDHRRVETPTSVNKNVTVPDGTADWSPTTNSQSHSAR